MTPFGSAQYSWVQRAIARSAGMAAAIYGYPVVETLRACRLHTRSSFDDGHDPRPTINALRHAGHPPIDSDQPGWRTDDSLHQTATWISLGDGPKRLTLRGESPAAGDGSQFFIHDAFGALAGTFGSDCLRSGIVLIGNQAAPGTSAWAGQVFPCATDLVRLTGREWPGSTIHLEGLGEDGALTERRPAAVELWQGKPLDAFVEVIERGQSAEKLAPVFFANLCRALAQTPASSADKPVILRLRQMGLVPDASLSWSELPEAVRSGLIEGFLDAAERVIEGANRMCAQPTCGCMPLDERQIDAYLARAVASRLGVGSPLAQVVRLPAGACAESHARC